jgi:lon-related putative ATP-dependent protease
MKTPRGAAETSGRKPAGGGRRLEADQIWQPPLLAKHPFKTTADLEAFDGVIEQDRAVHALELGLAINRRNYNIFVAGHSGTGRTTVVRRLLERVAPTRPTPPDWVYVNDFSTPDRPIPIALPAGEGQHFREAVEALVAGLTATLVEALHSRDHQQRIQRTLNSSLDAESEAFHRLSSGAAKHGFTVKSTKSGLVTLPVVRGEALSSKQFSELSARQQKRIERGRVKLEPLISTFLERAREIQRSTQQAITELQQSLAKQVAGPPLEALAGAWRAVEPAQGFLRALEEDLVAHLPQILAEEHDEESLSDTKEELRIRYAVNLVIHHGETRGAPIVFENHPTFYNLFGKVEKRVEQGMYATDLTMIRAGSIAKASGGYLVLHTADLFAQPMVWDQLKLVLRNREVEIEDAAEALAYVPTTGLRPRPIPIEVKLLLIGPPYHYDILFHGDRDFRKIFRVKADFDNAIPRTAETELEVARFIATMVTNDHLLPVDRPGVCAMIEEASRLAGDRERLTLHFNDIANLLLESNHQATLVRAKRIGTEHVKKAIALRFEIDGLIAEKELEAITDGQLLVRCEGQAVGEVNGLVVFEVNDTTFGRPVRISANTFAGKRGLVSIDQGARLSGRIHAKAVMTLAGWLGEQYAKKGPLALTVSLTMEQSYSRVEGDSASVADLIATLSSLSGVPIRQDLAVTGSMNQHGEVQSVGGIHAKVEGFYRVCKARGLNGTQGVVVPESNLRHLVLREEVREAVAAGSFHLYACRRIDEVLELMTGLPAAEVHRLAEAQSDGFREMASPRNGRLG